jgi:hypothetical protein
MGCCLGLGLIFGIRIFPQVQRYGQREAFDAFTFRRLRMPAEGCFTQGLLGSVVMTL